MPEEQHKELRRAQSEPDRLATVLKEGNPGVLQDILSELGPQVMWSLRRQYSSRLNAMDLEDVVSIALFRLWRHRNRFDPARSSLQSWFYLIARRVAIEALRGKQVGVQFEEWMEGTKNRHANVSERDLPEDAHPPPQDPRKIVLRRLLATMSDIDRQILFVSAETGPGADWTHLLADEFDITPEALRVRRSRMMQKLRRQLLD